MSLTKQPVPTVNHDDKDDRIYVVLEFRTEDWGQFHFCLKDPNGVYLDVVQAIEPTEEYKQGYTTE